VKTTLEEEVNTIFDIASQAKMSLKTASQKGHQGTQ
jgi:hypothetical protein